VIAAIPGANELARRLGTAGVYLFGVGAFLSSAASNVAFGLLMLAIILDRRRAWPLLRVDPSFWLIIGFTLYLAFALTFAWSPDGRAEDIDGSIRFLKLWLFLPLAYWLGGELGRITRFLLCCGAGFFIGCVAAIDWSTPLALITGERLRLGFSSINHFGLYSGTLYLGILAYAGSVWNFTAGFPQRLAWSMRVGWVVIGLVALYWVLASQSRGAIGSLAMALVFAALLVAYFRRQRATLFLLALMGAATLLAILLGSEFVIQRWSQESATVNAILHGDWSGIPYNAIGIRLHMIRIGWEWWLEHPWFGYGPGAVEPLLDGAVKELQTYKHLHNTLVDNLVRLGVSGTLLLQALFLYVALSLWRRLLAGVVPLSTGVFALASLMLAFLFGQTDYRMGAWDWRHYWAMLGGVSYALPLAQGMAQKAARS